VEVTCEVAEGGEEVASDEEGFVWKGKRVEVVEGEREEGWGGKERSEAVMVVVDICENGVGEI
jgi:hypothetical protein